MTPIDSLPRISSLAAALALVVALVGPAGAGPARAAVDPVGVWPLQPAPEVVHGFDPPASEYGAGHRGVDLAGTVGAVVRAALPGTVTYAGRLAGRGVVVVSHGDTRTTYEPVRATVEVGAAVAAGDAIGRLELALSHCFPAACLHWGWIRGETYLDPLRLVGGGPVRLLPLWRDLPAKGSPATAHRAAPPQPVARAPRTASWPGSWPGSWPAPWPAPWLGQPPTRRFP